MDNKTLSVVVLNYNDSETTLNFVKRVNNFENINYIVIVDNNSTDDSVEKLQQYTSSRIYLVKTNKNRGYAYGNNLGIKYAVDKLNSDMICISNPDVDFSDKLVFEAKNILNSIPNVGTVTGKMICPSTKANPIAWKLPNWIDCIIECTFLIRKLLKNKLYYNNKELNRYCNEVEAVPGSLFFINAETMKKIGLFDENTFLYYEENILAWKLKSQGFKNYIIDIPYIHNHSVTINKNIHSVNKRLRICQLSREYYCKEYLRCNNLKMMILKLIFEMEIKLFGIFKKMDINVMRPTIRQP